MKEKGIRKKFIIYRATLWGILLSILIGFNGCIREEKFTDDPEGNFNQLWKLIDEKYCFLEYKGIDWERIGADYRKYISREMDDEDLFYVLNNMLYELRDGHVNLTSESNQSNFDYWTEYPLNFTQSLLTNRHYLGNDYLEKAVFK